jgi:hypothetical protein
MDVLERVTGAGLDLLDRVDRVLASGGAPATDPVWPLLRVVGALPGEALRFAVSLDAEPLHATSMELRARSREFAGRRAALDVHIATGTWEGAGADAFGAWWRALADYVGDGTSVDQASLAGRLLAMASYVDAVVEWIDYTRGDVAMTVADALRSHEAVALRTSTMDDDLSRAASTIGVRVLATFSDSLRNGRDLHDEWSQRLSGLPFHPPSESPPPPASGATRAHL